MTDQPLHSTTEGRDRQRGPLPSNGDDWRVGEPVFESDATCAPDEKSAWCGHRRFAYDLVRFVRPSRIVELGTHWGTSFFAFCQAVKDFGLPTVCVAVDTWQGDQHTGAYGEEVFATVERVVSDHFAKVDIRLMKTLFADARERIDDGSVDILHIDGCHDYEAVAGDFNAWLCKVAPDGVVLLHDVAETGTFGTVRFWKELRERYPGFAFPHAQGLGVLFPNGERHLSRLARGGLVELILLYESRSRVDSLETINEDRQRHITNLGALLERAQGTIGEQSSEIQRLRSDVDRLTRDAVESRRSLADLAETIRDLHQTMAALQADRDDVRRERDELAAHVAAFRRQQSEWTEQTRAKNTHIRNLEAVITGVQESRGWGFLSFLRRCKHFALKDPAAFVTTTWWRNSRIILLPRAHIPPPQYADWLRSHERVPAPATGRSELAALAYQPLVSILMPTYNSDPTYLTAAIRSVTRQHYERWELLIVDDGSPDRRAHPTLDRLGKADPRIKVLLNPKNVGIAGASQAALAMATGEFVGLLDHDDVLAPHALAEVVRVLNDHPDTDMIYSDEDKLSPDGERCDPFFKPDWSPATFLSYMYTCHFGVYRKSLLDHIGGFRTGYDGSQDYDLVLRLSEWTDRIRHIPKVLYHWRMTRQSTAQSADHKHYASDAAMRALSDAMKRRGTDVRDVEPGRFPTTYRIRYRIAGEPVVHVIIPTRNNTAYLSRCLSSILHKTEYPRYRVHVIDNGSDDPETLTFLSHVTRESLVEVHRYARPFNFSAINNWAASQTDGRYLLFLNDDTEVIAPGWLDAMLEHAQQDAVGAVGAKLLYPDGSVQHAGVILGIGGVAGHAHKRFPGDHHGYFSRLQIVQNVSAVTAACLMTRREVFEKVGGFNEKELAVAFNDIDFCLKVRAAGYQIIYTPYAELYHHESVSRGGDVNGDEVRYMQRAWGDKLTRDPYYNVNLTLHQEDFSLCR